MNVFKRMSDIISSNVNSALDKLEDPKKMINLMVSELEETEREIKISIAEKEAECTTIKRNITSIEESIARWESRAKMAVDEKKDDLAREAIIEKRNANEQLKLLNANLQTLDNISASLKKQLSDVSDKIYEMKSKRDDLLNRASAAKEKMKTNETLNKAESIKYAKRFEELQSRIEKWEAEAKLLTPIKREKTTLESFEEIEMNNYVEAELNELKSKN